MNEASRKEVAGALQDGSPSEEGAPLERLLPSARSAVARMACMLAIPPRERDDLVGDVLLRALTRLVSRERPSPDRDGSLEAWILTLSHDICVERIRKRDRGRQRAHRPALPPVVHPPEHALAEEVEHFEHLLERVSRPESRRVVRLRVVESMTFPEIATLLKEKEGTVRQRFARALPCVLVPTGSRSPGPSQRRSPSPRCERSRFRSGGRP